MNEQSATALSHNNARYASPSGVDLFNRLTPYSDWINARIDGGYFPYARTLASPPAPEAKIAYIGRDAVLGVNLAVQDYLGLSSHPAIAEAAIRAITDFGVHSAGSPMLLGNNPASHRLEQALSEWLCMDHVLLFPTGWSAGFGIVKGLIRPDDHIVMDALAHACLQEGAAAATKNVVRYRHLNVDDARARLDAIRKTDTRNAILVVTESLYSMDSDTPDLAALQLACREFNARLVVDVAHDLGATGPDGAGVLGAQGLLGKVDLVIGAFSKTFASNGGFIATRDHRVKAYLRWFASPHTFSNAISPVQCAIVTEAVSIIRSPAGERRRGALAGVVSHFRNELMGLGCEVMGDNSAIVPVLIGRESIARRASKIVNERGIFTNLVEFPAVGLRQARFRCQLMATHTLRQTERAAVEIATAIRMAIAHEKEGDVSNMLGLKDTQTLTQCCSD